jgi:parvulin-like peptidyl-prolyl isomerase
VGRVGGEDIKLAEYELYIRALSDTLRGSLTDQEILRVQQQAWQNLIADRIWAHFLKAEGITATDDEVFEILKANPPPGLTDEEALKTDGKFDPQKYWAILAAPQNRPYFEQYAQQLKRYLLQEKGRWDILLSYRLTHPQAQEFAAWEETGVKATYLYLGPKLIQEELKPGPGELEAYYEAHKEELKRPKRYWLRYLFFPKSPAAADSAAAQSTIEEAYETLRSGEEFGWVARDFSEAPLDTNWRSINSLDPQSRTVVESLRLGTFSKPFLISQGFRILRLDDRNNDSVKLSMIAVNLRCSRETLDSLRQGMEQIRARAGKEDLDSLGTELGLAVRSLPPITEGEVYFPGLLDPTPLETFLAHIRIGGVSEPLRGQNGYFLFKLERMEPAGPPKFEEVEHFVEARWADLERQKRLKQYGAPLLEELMAGASLEAVAAQNPELRLDSLSSSSFQDCRSQWGAELAGALYALEEGETVKVETEWGVFIIRCDLRTRSAASKTALEQFIEEAITQISRQLFAPHRVEDYRDAFFY